MRGPLAKSIHETSGRLRVSIPAAKGNKEYMLHIQAQLSNCPVVTSVSANPLTGNVLILHHGDRGQIAHYAESKSLFKLVAAGKPRPGGGIAETTMSVYHKVDAGIRKMTGGEVDLPHAAFVTALGAGAVQVLRGRISPPNWHTAFWYAFNFFVLSLKKEEKKK